MSSSKTTTPSTQARLRSTGPGRRRRERASRPLEPPHRRAAVEADDQVVAQGPGLLQEPDVAGVEHVEAPAGGHHDAAGLTDGAGDRHDRGGYRARARRSRPGRAAITRPAGPAGPAGSSPRSSPAGEPPPGSVTGDEGPGVADRTCHGVGRSLAERQAQRDARREPVARAARVAAGRLGRHQDRRRPGGGGPPPWSAPPVTATGQPRSAARRSARASTSGSRAGGGPPPPARPWASATFGVTSAAPAGGRGPRGCGSQTTRPGRAEASAPTSGSASIPRP